MYYIGFSKVPAIWKKTLETSAFEQTMNGIKIQND